jgi:hypothetical protein
MHKKREIPFRQKDGTIIWILPNGEEREITWEELKQIVQSPEYKSREFITMPRERFEEWYKRMKLPKEEREFHKNFKRRHL